MGDLSLILHLLIYSIMYLYQYGFKNIYIYFQLYSNTTLSTLLLKLFQLWPLGQARSFSWLPCPFDIPASIQVYFLSTSLFPSTTRCFRLILCIFCPVLELAISTRILGSFYQRMVFKTKIWVLGILVATEMPFFVFNFYWGIIDLQCCVSFRCRAK